ncbi:hypothetical protein CGZ80_06735 [Rhodopirellula sp. MGV]|nr:hypothetical protein CGZ80_06735 [Rhodopirellula sp. MGV]PNY36196.1 hypothetical protein C2E31_13850 [Rhodopirellula baltica]
MDGLAAMPSGWLAAVAKEEIRLGVSLSEVCGPRLYEDLPWSDKQAADVAAGKFCQYETSRRRPLVGRHRLAVVFRGRFQPRC